MIDIEHEYEDLVYNVVPALRTEISTLRAENERLRKAIHELDGVENEHGENICAWCCFIEPNHAEDCARQIALKGGEK